MSKRSKGRRKSPFGPKGVYAILAIVFGLLLFMRVTDQSPERYAVLDLAEHPIGTVTPYVPKRKHFPAFYLVRSPDDDVYALVRIDRNSGCLVVWNDEAEQFEDPCQGHKYDWAGISLSGEGAGLDHLLTERTEANQVFIDMGQRVTSPNS